MYDLISIGDCTIDTLLQIHDAEVNCAMHPNRCVICFNFADKIPVDQIHRKVAGNAANNAVGASRLGLKTAIYTLLGNDGTGEQIEKTFKKEKVSLDYVGRDSKKETNSSIVINFKGERTIFVYHAPRAYQLPKLAPAKWIYYTSVGPDHAKLNQQIIKSVKDKKIKLGYNPGTFQLRAGFKQMRDILKICEVLFVNKEEAARIIGPQYDTRHYLLGLRQTGPKIVVITDGTAGSYIFDGEKFWQMGIYATPNIERTGAGDAFATGFLAALHYKKNIPTAMCWASANSSAVIMKYGPQDGLLTKSGIEEFHRKHKHKHAETF